MIWIFEFLARKSGTFLKSKTNYKVNVSVFEILDQVFLDEYGLLAIDQIEVGDALGFHNGGRSEKNINPEKGMYRQSEPLQAMNMNK